MSTKLAMAQRNSLVVRNGASLSRDAQEKPVHHYHSGS